MSSHPLAPAPPDAPKPRARRGLRLLALTAVGLALLMPLALAFVKQTTRAHSAAPEVAEQFVQALCQGNTNKAGALLTPEARSFGSSLATVAPFRSLRPEMGPTVKKGNSASTSFTLHFDDGPVVLQPAENVLGHVEALAQLRRQAQRLDGARGVVGLERLPEGWRVRSLVFPADEGGQGKRFDFAALAPQKSPPLSIVPAFQRMMPLGRTAFQKSWRITREERDRLPLELMRSLLDEVGLAIPANDVGPGKRRSFRFAGLSRIQAIDEACRAADCHLHWRGMNIEIAPGLRRRPATFTGPFLVELTDLKEDPPSATATLTLQAVAALPEPVAVLMVSDRRPLRPPVVSGEGRDLLHPRRQVRLPPPAIVRPLRQRAGPLTVTTLTWSVAVKGLVADVNRISVRGWVRVPLPARVETIRLSPLVPGTSASAGGLRLVVRKVDTIRQTTPRPQDNTALTLGVEGPVGRHLFWAAEGANERQLQTGQAPLAAGGLRLVVPEGTIALLGKVVTVADEEHEFVLANVPLRSRPLRKLGPALFPGHAAPVSVVYRGLLRAVPGLPGPRGLPSVRLLATNHTQKDVEELHLRLLYRDGKGLALAEQAALWSPAENPPLTNRPVEAHSTTLLQVVARAMPAQTRSVTVTLTRVLFRDDTE